MAERRDIVAAVRQVYGGDFINLNQVGQFFGMSPNTTKKWVAGMDYYQHGREKKFMAKDLAEQWSLSKSTAIYGGDL